MTTNEAYTDPLLRREIWLKAKTESGLALTDEDIHMCILTMERKGVSYFRDHIWANRRWDKHSNSNKIVWTLSAAGRRAIAHQHGLAGMDPIQFEVDADGMPVLARVRVFRRNPRTMEIDEYWGEARWSEYVEKNRKGEIQQQWLRRPFAQLGKCAEMQGLRRGFPEMELEDGVHVSDGWLASEVIKTEVNAEPEPEPEAELELGLEPEPQPQPKPKPKPKPEPEPEPEGDPKPEPEPEPDKSGPEVSGSPEHKAQVNKVLEETGRLDALKGEGVILFKAWADKHNGGESMSWKAVYEKLCGVIIPEGRDMLAHDYEALNSTFKDKLNG